MHALFYHITTYQFLKRYPQEIKIEKKKEAETIYCTPAIVNPTFSEGSMIISASFIFRK